MSHDAEGRAHRRQPALHHLVSLVAAPALVLSEPDGQILGPGACGWYVDDVRLLDTIELGLEHTELDLVRSSASGAGAATFVCTAPGLAAAQHDPAVFVDRTRTVSAAGMVEEIVVSSTAPESLDVVVHLRLRCDFTSTNQVRQGWTRPGLTPASSPTTLSWSDEGREVSTRATPEPASFDAETTTWTWTTTLTSSQPLRVRIELTSRSSTQAVFGPGGGSPWHDVAIRSPDARLDRLVQHGLRDLAGLLLRDEAGVSGDLFLAAGSPWFLTLFGRDSLWASRMLLPVGTDLAMSTLRALARRQGTHDDTSSEEQPGKIVHEVRSRRFDLGSMSLPPLYYGSVDATPLFVIVLAEAWRWGASARDVAALLPAARKCLTWMMAQSEDTGWLRYVDQTGRGLANQGWKDSHDSIQFADGSLARAPIALSEVQAYAYQAAVVGAELLHVFEQRPVEGLEKWSRQLRDRFATNFWVRSPSGDYPAVALDGDNRRVDSVASNLGHLLGTGILDPDQVALVAARLASPELDSGFGLRTLSSASPRFSRLSYHGGTVWPHDTAIAVTGLAREGGIEQAGSLLAGVVAAAESFGYRLPELYGGEASSDVPAPSAYPSACRPQAWAAAAPLACLVSMTGLAVDVPAGRITCPDTVATPLGPFRVEGLRAGTHPLMVEVDDRGRVRVETTASMEVCRRNPGEIS